MAITWTPILDEALREASLAGKSGRQIADMLALTYGVQVSRSAVIARAGRLDVACRAQAPARTAPADEAPRAKGAWSRAADARLIELRRAGVTAGDISKTLRAEGLRDASRNAVIGRCDRLAASGTVFPVTASGSVRPMVPRRASKRAADVPPRPAAPDRRGLEPLTPRTGIETLSKGQCRWPYGRRLPFAWCGRKAEDGSYCRAHAAAGAGDGTPSERDAHKGVPR